MIFQHAFGVAWLWNIKYLCNPWNTSLRLFSLVWVSKTHMLTSLPLAKHFQGRLGGGCECKNTSISVCQRCLGTMGISYRRCWRVCTREKWSCLVPASYLVFIWPLRSRRQPSRRPTVPLSSLIYASFD